jgi:hypothetical protein
MAERNPSWRRDELVHDPGDRKKLIRLRDIVNRHLYDPDLFETAPYRAAVSRENPPRIRSHVVPVNLLTFMWVQLLQKIETERAIVRCRACPNWMLIAPEVGSRKHRRFCSDACRVRNTYHIQQSARDLYGKSMQIRAIRRRLRDEEGWAGTEKQVQKWVMNTGSQNRRRAKTLTARRSKKD